MKDERTPPAAERIKAMNPTPKNGDVSISDPPNGELVMSPIHAEMSAVRLLDAADKAQGD